jgi:hypothetical protein
MRIFAQLGADPHGSNKVFALWSQLTICCVAGERTLHDTAPRGIAVGNSNAGATMRHNA